MNHSLRSGITTLMTYGNTVGINNSSFFLNLLKFVNDQWSSVGCMFLIQKVNMIELNKIFTTIYEIRGSKSEKLDGLTDRMCDILKLALL